MPLYYFHLKGSPDTGAFPIRLLAFKTRREVKDWCVAHYPCTHQKIYKHHPSTRSDVR